MQRAVIFDVDGVLIQGYGANPQPQHRWDETLYEDLGIDPDRFRREFIFDVFVKKVVVGEMPVIKALEARLPSLGYSGSPMRFLHYWLSRDSKLNQPLIEAIQRFKARTQAPLFIATNQEHMRALWLWQGLGLCELFDDMFYSARLGVRKPDARFFRAIEQRLGRLSEPPLFFDDTPEVVDAARKHGWEAVRFERVEDFASHPFVAPHLG